MTLSISGPEINNATTAVEHAANTVTSVAQEIESQVAATTTIYEPKILSFFKWAKAVFIAVMCACFFIVIAALSVVIG